MRPPEAASSALCVRTICASAAAGASAVSRGWVKVWSPTAPILRSARIAPGTSAMFLPTTKKVARRPCFRSLASIRRVYGPGPSSNVSADLVSPATRAVDRPAEGDQPAELRRRRAHARPRRRRRGSSRWRPRPPRKRAGAGLRVPVCARASLDHGEADPQRREHDRSEEHPPAARHRTPSLLGGDARGSPSGSTALVCSHSRQKLADRRPPRALLVLASGRASAPPVVARRASGHLA